ncbi:MAG: ATP-dependent helicase [Anaerolineae bacterium]
MLRPKVAISSDFLTAFAGIPKSKQKKVREFITRFELDPTAASINYESIQAKDTRVRTARIDLEYRAIILHPPKGDVYLLVWVDHHDEAMAWAKNKQFEVNPTTGALQVIDAVAVEHVVSEVMPAPSKPLDAYGPYETFDDANLLQTGIPQPLLPAVKALPTADALESLKPYLPDEAYEALFWIGHFGYSVQQALNEMGARPEPPTDPDDLAAALNHPDSQRRFATVKSATELAEMLNAPLEKWRIFLHPSQAQLVRRDFSGPARVLGGAGTGKTVVAMHRACHLAAEKFTATTDRILFTTYTRNLARNIEANLHNLCPAALKRVEVVNLHRWAVAFMHSQGLNFQIASSAEVDDCWRDAFSAVGAAPWGEAFFRQEWAQVAQTHGVTNRADYLRAPRTGRGVRLTRKERLRVWEIFEEYQRNLKELGKVEWLDVIRQTRQYLAQKPNMLPYRAVIVDETQDLHPEELKLIRQIVPEGDNDIFLVGDAHQRIYGRPVVLSHCGINVVGRSRKLKINYRTTEEIRNWAVAVLRDQSIDDLDGGADTHQSGYRSLLTGVPPEVHNFSLLADERAFLLDKLMQLTAEVPAETICIVARTHRQITEDYLPALEHAGMPHLYLQQDHEAAGNAGVRVATMHRVKGLEFNHIIIAGATAHYLPLHHVTTPEQDDPDALLRERCLLHVAATRARDTLTITSYGPPSVFLPADNAN